MLKNNTSKIAIYPGTFDPITLGHMELIKRSSPLFDLLIVAVAIDTQKATLFSANSRLQMVNIEVNHSELTNVQVCTFGGLLVDFAESNKAKFIIRGLRAVSDFEFEFQLAYINHKLNSNIETIFLPGTEDTHFISSTFVKEIARLGGSLDKLVSKRVADTMRSFYNQHDKRVEDVKSIKECK